MSQAGSTVNLLRIFIGSPSDVGEERKIARQLIDNLNSSPHYRGQRFEAITWDQTAYPRIAWVSPQKAIEENLPKPSECDLAVFIFWSRVGTPLPARDYPEWPAAERLPEPEETHRTGSVWGFYQAMAGANTNGKERPPVLLLRGTHDPVPDFKDPAAWGAQVQACRDFFAALNPDGYRINVIDYRGTEAFRDTLQAQLDQTLAPLAKPPADAVPTAAPTDPSPPLVPDAYRRWIRKQVAKLDNPGLDDKAGVTISLAQIYVPAVTIGGERAESTKNRERQQHALMLDELNQRSLYVPGQPGSGKTTFCRWVLGVVGGAIPLPSAQSERLPEAFQEPSPSNLRQRLPVLIRLRDLADTLNPTERDWSSAQFWSALGEWLERKQWADGALTSRLVEAHRAAGTLLLLLDGVDEVATAGRAPDGRPTYPRKALLSGLVNALNDSAFQSNRVLLTSRPYGLSRNEETQLPLARRDLSPLPPPLQNGFIEQWFQLAMPPQAQETASALRTQLEARTDLTELRTNPLMLHALCVKFYDGNQLPEDIHDLYASIVSRVPHSRYERDTRDIVAANRRLQVIALDMHTGQYSGQTRTQPMASITYGEIESALTSFADEGPFDESTELSASQKLRDLLDNSGLLFSRDQDSAEFAHLMFSYFLASERLRVNKTSLRESLQAYGNSQAWHPTLQFRFAYEARESLQQAMEALEALADDVSGEKLAAAPYKAALIGRCLEIASRRGRLGDWATRYQDVARRSLAAPVESSALTQVYRSLGLMHLDDRPGIGLDANGLPAPKWIEVPAGSVVLEKHSDLPGEGEHAVAAFEIACYPTTHQQFQAFLDAEDGYGKGSWWDGLEKELMPSRARHAIGNYPRDSVSWNDAVAYCRWLSARLQCVVRLPTEAQWQLAAGGPHSKTYPWANEWDPAAANAGGGNQGVCTAVGLWPRDRGESGAFDFAGGLTEWCALPLGADKLEVAPLKGAAWVDDEAQRPDGRAAPSASGFIRTTASSASVFGCVVAPHRPEH